MQGNIVIFLALAVSGVLNFVAIALYSRLLSPAEYGIYAVIMASIGLVLGFVFLWLDLSFGRFVAGENKNKSRVYFSNFIALYFILLLLVSVLLGLLALFGHLSIIEPKIFIAVGLVIFAEVVFNAVNIYSRLVQGALVRYSFSVIARSGLAIGFAWYFLELGYSYYGIFLASALSFAIPSLISMVMGRIWKDFSLLALDRHVVKEVFNFGVPLMVVMVVQAAISATDRFLLASMLGSDVAGQYSASQDLVVKLFIFLLAIVHKVNYPNVIRIFEMHGEKATQSMLDKHILLLLLISIPAVFAMTVYSGNIANVILGEDFREMAIELIPYQVGIAFINCITMFYAIMPFHLLKKTKLLVIPSVIALLANLIIGYFLITIFGIYGAVIGSFVAYSVYFSVSLLLGYKLLRLPLPSFDLLKIISCSLLMVLILIPFRESDDFWSLVCLVLIGGGSYAAFVVIANIGGYRNIIFEKLSLSKRVK